MIRTLRQKARRGEFACGTFVFEFFEAGVAMMAKQAGAEFAVLDMEHSGVGLDRLKPLILLCRAVGVAPIVRVPDSQYHHIAGALDIGAQGIMIPMVETAEQMRTIIRYSKYYPKGARGNAFGIAHDDYAASGPIRDKMAELNESVMLIPLIESRQGADNAAEIAELAEVDVLWIGHLDLTQSLGIPGEWEHPEFTGALQRIFAAAGRSGKSCGILLPDHASLPKWYERGVRFFSYSADLWLFQHALTEGIAKMKKIVESYREDESE